MRRLMGLRKSDEEAKVMKIISVPTSEKQDATRSMVSSAGSSSFFAILATGTG